MNLTDWAASHCVAYVSVRRQYAAETLPVPTSWLGRLLVDGDRPHMDAGSGQSAYSPVAFGDQRANPDRQIARVSGRTPCWRLAVDRVVTELGSALHNKRRKLRAGVAQ